MKTKIIVTILLTVIATLGVYGYFKAIPGLENQTNDQPQIKVAPQTFDFGKIEYGAIAEHSFKIKNSGNQNLNIKKLATSCACTTASVAKEQITPGEETELKVVYDTGAMSGPHGKGKQERIIYIKSNDPLNPQVEVMIYANVK